MPDIDVFHMEFRVVCSCVFRVLNIELYKWGCPSSQSQTISPLLVGLLAAQRVQLRSPDSPNLCETHPYQIVVKLYWNILILIPSTQSVDILSETMQFIYCPLNLNPIHTILLRTLYHIAHWIVWEVSEKKLLPPAFRPNIVTISGNVNTASNQHYTTNNNGSW